MLPLAPLEGRKGEDSVTFGENEESLEQGRGKEGDWTKSRALERGRTAFVCFNGLPFNQ